MGFWDSLDKETAGDAILTGYKGDLAYMPLYEEVHNKVPGGHSVLDFGCGVGRNIPSLVNKFEKVVGYDFPNMLDLVPEGRKQVSNDPYKLSYSSNWDYVSLQKYDCIFASLVFQHIDEEELNTYLSDMQGMLVNKLVVHSRTTLDNGTTLVLPIIEKYFALDSIDYKKDPNSAAYDHFIAVFKHQWM
jgi:cyclopropane fatty-acyl-phospholipid synthase-like methyltransferase